MAVEITGRYAGGLKVDLRHGPSGAEIRTAAPVDNNGDGSSFSPTDLLAASLGTCMVTVMGIYAQKNGIPFEERMVRFDSFQGDSRFKNEVLKVNPAGRVPVLVVKRPARGSYRRVLAPVELGPGARAVVAAALRLSRASTRASRRSARTRPSRSIP